VARPVSRRPGATRRLEIAFLSSPGATVDPGRRHFRATAWGDEAIRVLRDWHERWQRLEREETQAEHRAAGRRAAAKRVLALVLSGVLGGHALAAGGDSERRPGCAAFEAVGADFVLGEPEGDALGAVTVRCAPDGQERLRGERVEGIARLLEGERVDPNTAARELLENLPGVGPGRAGAIVEARERSPFEATRDLERVPGIGPRTLEKLEPFLEVDSETPSG
jgi:competence ComEA-like helix-hairpin-helix protein